jgi:serine/threonine protein kinase
MIDIIHSKLTHPNIVECFGISTSQQHIYILLELMDGDLKNYLRRNRDINASTKTNSSDI